MPVLVMSLKIMNIRKNDMDKVRTAGAFLLAASLLGGCSGKDASFTKAEGLLGGGLLGAGAAILANEPTGNGAIIGAGIGYLAGNRCQRRTYDDLTRPGVEVDEVSCGGAAAGYDQPTYERPPISYGPTPFR